VTWYNFLDKYQLFGDIAASVFRSVL